LSGRQSLGRFASAENRLRQKLKITEADPNCAMSYWGIAMSVWNQLWAPPRPDSLKEGIRRYREGAIDNAQIAA
jgi:hypothetical protein